MFLPYEKRAPAPPAAPRQQRHGPGRDAPALHGDRALQLAAPDLLDATQRRERVRVVEEAPPLGVAHAHLAERPARRGKRRRHRLRGRPAHELHLLDEVAQALADGGLGVDVRRHTQGLVGPHHLVLAPHAILGVEPHDPVALLGRHKAVELDGVLAAELLGVRDGAHRRQDAQAPLEAVEQVKRRDRHQAHLS